MGLLANYLQEAFMAQPPTGWTCRREVHVLSSDFEQLLGYSPRADVCLEAANASRRIWIEFEISRADPVANHAKFATAHLFKPFETSTPLCRWSALTWLAAEGILRQIRCIYFGTLASLHFKQFSCPTLSQRKSSGLTIRRSIVCDPASWTSLES